MKRYLEYYNSTVFGIYSDEEILSVKKYFGNYCLTPALFWVKS